MAISVVSTYMYYIFVCVGVFGWVCLYVVYVLFSFGGISVQKADIHFNKAYSQLPHIVIEQEQEREPIILQNVRQLRKLELIIISLSIRFHSSTFSSVSFSNILCALTTHTHSLLFRPTYVGDVSYFIN